MDYDAILRDKNGNKIKTVRKTTHGNQNTPNIKDIISHDGKKYIVTEKVAGGPGIDTVVAEEVDFLT